MSSHRCSGANVTMELHIYILLSSNIISILKQTISIECVIDDALNNSSTALYDVLHTTNIDIPYIPTIDRSPSTQMMCIRQSLTFQTPSFPSFTTSIQY